MKIPVRAADVTVGDALPPVTHGPVDRVQLALFAASSGDHNPIHLDDAVARANGLPGAIVHGMLSMAFLGQVLTGWVPQLQIRSFGTRFASMAYPGDMITCKGVVTAKEGEAGKALVKVDLRAENQKGETLLAGNAEILLS